MGRKTAEEAKKILQMQVSVVVFFVTLLKRFTLVLHVRLFFFTILQLRAKIHTFVYNLQWVRSSTLAVIAVKE